MFYKKENAAMRLRLSSTLLLAMFAAQAQTGHWLVTWSTAESLRRPQLPGNPQAQPPWDML
jgi:hypothetical protein